MRNWRRTKAEISELGIVGSPTIPTELSLISGPSLRGWSSYYDSESNSGLGTWTTAVDADGVSIVTSERSDDPLGCWNENLLYYVRPLTWDATVSYEFEYQEGECMVHPCLGRSVFLIRPEGIWLHQLTDGRYERSTLRPDNAVRLVDFSADTNSSVVLTEGWNRAELQIEANHVGLSLNDQRVAAFNFELDESPTFGFFHYSDQSRVRVRNAKLKGDWPRALPMLDEQPLASQVLASWNATAERLPASWSHDFRRGVPLSSFLTSGGVASFAQQPDGIRLRHDGDVNSVTIDLTGQIQGDFDIVLTFKELDIGDEKPTWHSGVGVAITLANASRDRLDVVRRRDRLNEHQHIVFARNTVNQHGGVDWVSDTTRVDESTAGRLRILRRDDVIYGLFADGNSNSFRYLDRAKIESGKIAAGGLRMYNIAGENMTLFGDACKLGG
ncbi:MAG: DUF1583 domain-containing protein [Pirellulaceae bacterium]